MSLVNGKLFSFRIGITSRIMDINMHSSQIAGDIDMETIQPQKSSVMVECTREREDIGRG